MREHLASGFSQWLHWFAQTAMLVGIPVVLLLLVLGGKLFYQTLVNAVVGNDLGTIQATNDLGTIVESPEAREARINNLANQLRDIE